MIKYISTRGTAPVLNFADATLAGLATDGGLYVPQACPKITPEEIANMANQKYIEIAWRVILPFVSDNVTPNELTTILRKAYKGFHHKDIAPIHSLTDHLHVLELFHGPTLAFKDMAMQFLGHVFDFILAKRGEKITIVGATSGDTGSAAIEAFKKKENINIIILHPYERVSEVQRRQMTSVDADNVWNVAVKGDFDSCQNIVKAMFNDHGFREEVNLSAVNSINWARIVAQIVYYVYASSQIAEKTGRKVTFSVPTGNFGNVYAGYIAKSMGAPIHKLIVATNSNDILHRFFQSGEMKKELVTPTLSPSMDIQISSNFERLLFDVLGRDAEKNVELMNYFAKTGPFKLEDALMANLHNIFESNHFNDADTLKIIHDVYETYGYVLDPHTAVGVGAAQNLLTQHPDSMFVSLATAHPAKFPDAVEEAIGLRPPLPDHLSELHDRPEKYDVLEPRLETVQEYIRERI